MIYVVLGMHKSGTTLVSQILHRSGIHMGEIDESVSYDTGNKFERQSTLALNMRILGTDDFEVLDLAPPARPALTPEQREAMRRIIRECGERHQDWGFKDPRTCLTYPLWAEELPPHRLIAVFRHPSEIWPRFRYAGLKRFHTNPSRARRFLARWYEHNVNVLRYLRESGREHLVISYAELMGGGEEFQRLERFVGRPLADARNKRLYRSRLRNSPLLWLAEQTLRRRHGGSVHQIMQRFEAQRRLDGVPTTAR